MKTINIDASAAKPWWPGDKRVEPFMKDVQSTIKKHVHEKSAAIDIYNRAYEAVHAAIKVYGDKE